MTPEELAKQAAEEMKKAFEEFKKANDERIKAVESKGSAPADLEEKLSKINKALDDAEAKQRKALDEIEKKLGRLELGGKGMDEKGAEAKAAFLSACRRGEHKLSADERKVLVVSSDSTGGFLAPTEVVNEIIRAEVLYSPMRSLVTVRTTGMGEVGLPKRTGTAAATRVGETQQRGETQNPSWGFMKISAPEMYAEARVTFANLEDSMFDLEGLLRDEFSEQFGVKEGQEVISGNGVNQCLGLLDANAAGPGKPLTNVPSGHASQLTADGLIDLQHSVKTAYAANGAWAFNRKTLAAIRKMKDSQNRPLWEPSIQANLPAMLLGRPYAECPDMPDVAAGAYPVAFGDFRRGYLIVDRTAIVVTRDELTLASVGQVKFNARRRVGGQVVLGEAIQLQRVAAS